MTKDVHHPDVQKRIKDDLKEIRTLADEIKKASRNCEKLLAFSPADEWEWEQEMSKIHTARKKIRWIICEKRGRFV